MIISRTPLRISFVGGGSDLPVFYKKNTGAVISTSINKFIYIIVNRQFDGRIILTYSSTEIVNDINKIKNNLIREAMKMTKIDGGIHITSISDIPSEGSGLGSSSSYLVGLLHALYTYKGQNVTAERLAKEACKIEIELLKKPIGKQDQYIAAYGGFQYIEFYNDGTVHIDPIIASVETRKRIQNKMLLFYTGITRSADIILLKQNKNLKKDIKRQIMNQMVGLAGELKYKLQKNNIDNFGEILHKNWELKKQMAEGIFNDKINKWYETAIKNGASGGKLLGAGGGGFLLFYAPENTHKKIIKSLSDLKYVDFNFEKEGSKIIFKGD